MLDLELTAEVNGRVLTVDERVDSGRTVAPEQVLVRIDDLPLRRALAEARRSLADARLELAQEQSQAARARAEWATADFDIEPSALVFRKPQLAAAQAAVDAAVARVEAASDELSKAEVRAPFPALVIERLVDPGDVVSSGTPLARLVSQDRVEIRVPLSDRQWAILDASADLPVEVSSQAGGEHWSGYVLRSERHVNISDRQRALVIAIDQPLEQAPPLYPGTFVAVHLPSRPIDAAFRLPASALTPDGHLWYIDAEGQARRFRPRAHFRFDDDIVAIPPASLDTADIVIRPLASLSEGTPVIARHTNPGDGPALAHP
jgi:RND family efflux transporter MFP subunit